MNTQIEYWDKRDIMELLKIGDRQAKALLRTPGCPVVHIGNAYRVQSDLFLRWINTAGHIKLDYSKT